MGHISNSQTWTYAGASQEMCELACTWTSSFIRAVLFQLVFISFTQFPRVFSGN